MDELRDISRGDRAVSGASFGDFRGDVPGDRSTTVSDCARRRFSVRLGRCGVFASAPSSWLKFVPIALNTSHSSPHFGIAGALGIFFAINACKSCVDVGRLFRSSRSLSDVLRPSPPALRLGLRNFSNRSMNLASSSLANESWLARLASSLNALMLSVFFLPALCDARVVPLVPALSRELPARAPSSETKAKITLPPRPLHLARKVSMVPIHRRAQRVHAEHAVLPSPPRAWLVARRATRDPTPDRPFVRPSRRAASSLDVRRARRRPRRRVAAARALSRRPASSPSRPRPASRIRAVADAATSRARNASRRARRVVRVVVRPVVVARRRRFPSSRAESSSTERANLVRSRRRRARRARLERRRAVDAPPSRGVPSRRVARTTRASACAAAVHRFESKDSRNDARGVRSRRARRPARRARARRDVATGARRDGARERRARRRGGAERRGRRGLKDLKDARGRTRGRGDDARDGRSGRANGGGDACDDDPFAFGARARALFEDIDGETLAEDDDDDDDDARDAATREGSGGG